MHPKFKEKLVREPFEFTQITTWWDCGAPDCKTFHVDAERAYRCPERRRALRRSARVC
jgi:hypothetical protein